MHLIAIGSFLHRRKTSVTKTLLVMKLTIILLTVTMLEAGATGFSQSVSISERNVRLESVFKKIEKQTGYYFWYENKALKDVKKISVELQNASLQEALNKCLAGLPLDYLIVEKTIVIKAKSPQESRQQSPDMPPPPIEVRGKILDENGSPLQGATVKLKGTSTGTSTDAGGNFVLSVPGTKGTLVISFIGYENKELPVNASLGTITLQQKVASVDEIVIVGYGTQKKVNATGAIAQVSGKDLENRPVTRVSQALQGMVGNLNITTSTAGGAPNATQNINIRGYTGFGISSEPLIVIDGVQGGNINNLNPDDIENISVVKDAASAAIYGSSAPNGVILITTKQGKKGKTPAIIYSNNLQWATPVNMPKMVNSLDFANLYNEAALNGGRAVMFSDAVIQRIKDYQAGTFKDETVQTGYPNDLKDSWESWSGSNANNDWFKIYFKNAAFSQQHNIGVSGGSESSTYYVGLGYNDRQGMYNFGDDRYKRFNIRANISTDISKWLSFSLRTTVARELFNTPNTYSGKTGGNYMHQIARKWPTVPLFNPDGLYSDNSDVRLHMEGGRNKEVTDNAILTGEFNFKLAKGWTATVNYTFNGTFYKQDFHTKTVYAYRPSGAQYIMTGSPNGFQRRSDRTQYQVVNAFTKYETSIGDDHNISILGGFTSDLREYETYSASNSQLYSDNIPSLSTSYGTTPSVSDAVRRLASEGFFGRINYNFKGKYLLELNGRYDATSRFLSDVRWKFYPGISAGWNIDKENFFASVASVVSSLKLRGSYGSLGDQGFLDANAPNWYPFYPSLGTTRPTNTGWLFNGAQQAAVTPPGLVNPALTWVTTTQLNLGVDAGFFDNRLQGSFDWYIRKANDFAYSGQALPAVLGTGVPLENNAGIETRGFELSIGWRDRIGSVNYSVRGILSDYRGKITRYANNPNNDNGTFYVGRQQGEIWGYTTVGLFQSDDEVTKSPSQSKLSGAQWTPGDVRYADLNNDGSIDWGNNTLDKPGDRSVIGNNTPRYSYSFSGNLEWKNFDFMIFLQGIAKRDAWVGSNYFWGINGDEWQSSVFTEHLNRWTPETPDGYFPKFYLTSQMGKNMQTQTRYLQNAAYMRIKNVQLGYSIPSSVLNTIKFKRVRVYVSIENLATFTKLIKTMDPELSISDAKIYPLQRTYSLGVNVGL